ncbi:hypothetical protein [Elioraea sp.]|uniref:hypothetical protein n=1 Tax=Elioraea sp. TaxID=2185103 RepID=UPI0025C361B5|nr:hypothetical protein [Elioraea sp.]
MARLLSTLRRARRAFPPHVAFLLSHAAIGVTTGMLFVAALLALDVAGLRGLMLRSADGSIALGLLLLGTSITFGSAAMGAAIMGLGARPPADAPPRPRPARVPGPVTMPLLVRARR